MVVQKMKTAEDIATNQFEYLGTSQSYLSSYGKKGELADIRLGQGCAATILLMMNYPATMNGNSVVLNGKEVGTDKVFMINIDSIENAGCPGDILDKLKSNSWPDTDWVRPDVEPEPVKEPAPSLELITDALTGVYNRRGFDLHFTEAPQDNFGIIYFDANNLKETNDNMGHKYGDKLLVAIANILRDLFPDQIYRLGGDEFVVILDGVGPVIIKNKLEEFKMKLQAETENDPDGVVYSSAMGFCVNDGTMSMYEDKRAMKVAKEEVVETPVEEPTEPVAEEPVVEEAPAEEIENGEKTEETPEETVVEETLAEETSAEEVVPQAPTPVKTVELQENVVYPVSNLNVPSEDESVAETESKKNFATMWSVQYSFDVKEKGDNDGFTIRSAVVTLFPLSVNRPPLPVRFIACIECNGSRKIVYSSEEEGNYSVEATLGDYVFNITAQFFRSGKFRGTVTLDANSPYEIVDGSLAPVYEVAGDYIPKYFGKVLGNEDVGLAQVFPIENENDIDGNGCAACIYMLKRADGSIDTGYSDGETLRLFFRDSTNIYMCYWDEDENGRYFNVEKQDY